MTEKPKSVASLMQNSVLASIGATLELHRRTLKAIQRVLPDFLAAHCQDCVVKPNRLIIYSDSPLFTSQLRFYVPQLQTRLASEQGLSFREIQIRNLLQSTSPKIRPTHINIPSPEVAELLRVNAQTDVESELSIALNKLSETLARKNRQS